MPLAPTVIFGFRDVEFKKNPKTKRIYMYVRVCLWGGGWGFEVYNRTVQIMEIKNFHFVWQKNPMKY